MNYNQKLQPGDVVKYRTEWVFDLTDEFKEEWDISESYVVRSVDSDGKYVTLETIHGTPLIRSANGNLWSHRIRYLDKNDFMTVVYNNGQAKV